MVWSRPVRKSVVLSTAVALLVAVMPPAQAATLLSDAAGTVVPGTIIPAAPEDPASPELPSPEEIAAAKASEGATADEVAKIDGIVARTAAEQDAAGAASMKANNAYSEALVELRQRQETAAQATARAAAAAADELKARKQLGQLAGDLYRTGGLNPALSSFITGDGDTLQQAETLEAITASRTRAFDSAETAAAAAKSLTAAAEDANRAAKDAASAAEDRKSEADTASAALQKSVTDAKTQRAVLVTQLASLRSTTADLESKRLEALDFQRQQAQLAAVTAASDRAAAGPAVPAVQAQVNQPPAVADLPVQQPPAAPEAPAAPVAPAPPPAALLPAPTPPTAPSPGGSNQTAISAALGKVGPPYFYEYGGTGPYGFDCSGFTQNAFAAAGKYLPRTASQQFAQAPVRVPLAQAQPGDLLVWGSAPDFSHVAIYLGNGQVVQALNPSSGIQVTQLSWMAGMQLYPYAARY